MSPSIICRRNRILAVLVTLAIHPLLAIDPHRAMSQYVRDHWGTEQGFPRGSVYAITQTSDGYLWIGTEAGLVRFDGYQFRVITGAAGSAKFSSVLGLTADKDGGLWVAVRDMRILHYRDGKFDDPFSRTEAASDITAMARTNRGELLAAWLQNGVITYRDGAIERLASAEAIPRSPVISVAQTGDGAFWLGTRGAGLYRLRGGQTSPIVKGLPDAKINCLLADGPTNGAQGLWIGTDTGVAHWNGTELDDPGMSKGLKKYQILALARDADANLWAGTDSGGLLRINADGVASLAQGPGEAGDAVTALFEDREGSLWVGGANGIERLRDSPFVTYSVPEGLPTEGSNPLFVDAENRLWFPPADGGLWWLKDGRHANIVTAGLDRDIVYSIAGAGNELWVGRQRGGLTRLRLEHGAYAPTTYTKADGLAQDSVYSVYLAPSGIVWAGTLSGGASRLEQGKFTSYTIVDGLASNTVASILQTANGTVWFATPSGLSSLERGRFKTYRVGDGLPSEDINCLLEDSSGVLWAGTTAGLAFLRAGRFEVPARTSTSLREQILGLAEDRQDALWMTTSDYVVRVNRSRLMQGTLGDGDLMEYGTADGLRGVEGVKRQRSVVADSQGRIWMSLNRGISVVDPARLNRSSPPAIPHIQDVSADGNAIAMNGSTRIPAGKKRIVFSYAGLILSVPERLRFRYMLEGFDRGWSEPAADRQAAYTNLGPGTYRFRLMASNPNGAWSQTEANATFLVEPAYWQTWWFRLLGLVAFVLAIFAFVRLRMAKVTARLNDRFEERLAERTRIAQELHDTLLQGFISASMQVHVVADRLPPDSQMKAAATRALDLMRQVIEEGRNAVRGLRSTRSASMDLEEAFSRIQEELAPGGKSGVAIDFRVITEGERIPLHPVLRDEVYRIGREALTNAFRHAKAQRIEIELNYSTGAFRILVRDDGCGIAPETLQEGRDGHWGLSGMRERADRIGARLRLWSRPTGGTEVELTVPGSIAYRATEKATEKPTAKRTN